MTQEEHHLHHFPCHIVFCKLAYIAKPTNHD